MVKDHSDSERGNPLPPHRLLFPISSKGSFICTDRIIHTTAFVTPVVEHWLERQIDRQIDREREKKREIRTDIQTERHRKIEVQRYRYRYA